MDENQKKTLKEVNELLSKAILLLQPLEDMNGIVDEIENLSRTFGRLQDEDIGTENYYRSGGCTW